MTRYWWAERGWGDRSVDLVGYLKDGPRKYGNSEFVLIDSVSPGQYGSSRGHTHDSTLAPPSDFLCRAQSALGDCLVEVPTYISWYQPEAERAKESPYARWLYNFGNSNYGLDIELPAGKSSKRVALTSFTQRARMIAQFSDWSYVDADAIMQRLAAKSLNFRDKEEVIEDWEVSLEEDQAFIAEGLWRPLLTNPYMPVGEAEPVYRKLAEAHLRQLEKRRDGGNVYIVTDSVGFFSQNPNTPSEYLVRAVEASERIIKADMASQRESLQDYIGSIYRHPNFPGGDQPFRRKSANFEDSVLFDIFSKPYDPATTDLSGIAAELLSNTAREEVLRRILSHLFTTGESVKIALLLPAAGAILEEFNDALGDTSDGVPFEWLMAAAG